MTKTGTAEPRHQLLYGIDDIPPWGETVSLGLQHYLTMFGSTVAIPLILSGPLGIAENPAAIAQLISTMFFVSGLATLVQTTWGSRLPIVQGGTFSFLAPAVAICAASQLEHVDWTVRMQHLQGAIIIAGAVEMALGFSGLIGKLLRFVGPITIAPTITLIGLSLFKFGAPVAGTHWGIGGLTIFLIVLFSQYLRRRHRVFELYPILMAILIAWGVAAVLSAVGVFGGATVDVAGQAIAAHPAYVDVSSLTGMPWFSPPYPGQWGLPQFSLAAVVGMLAGVIASMVESIGDYYACARLAGAPVPDAKTINRGIGMEGLGCVVAGFFGTGNGTTSYSENIGAIGLTRVGSRRVVQAGAVLMLGLAMVGKFGGVFTTIPQPVVGGMYCAMFGMIAAVGLSTLQFVDLNSSRNLFVLGFSLFMGLSLPEYFNAHPIVLGEGLQWLSDILNTLGKTGMAVGAVAALLLDNTIPGTAAERGIAQIAVGRSSSTPDR